MAYRRNFFRHFLESPEQGLLVIALFANIDERGGATQLACDWVDHVAGFLAAPAEVLHDEIPADDIVRRCDDVIDATGEIGDVYLVHPFMLHTWSVNKLDVARFITNPPATLRDAMRVGRPRAADHSPVERAVLRAPGVDRHEFVATAPREHVVPERLQPQHAQYEELRATHAGTP